MLKPTYDEEEAALANVLLLSILFPTCIPLARLLRADNAELVDDDDVLGLDDIVRNRVVVECNNLFLEMDATDGINLDVDVLDILVRGIIFAKGVDRVREQ
jgi:hypothetical protein